MDISAPSVKRPMPRMSMAVASTNESISPVSTGTSTKQMSITIRLMGRTDAVASRSFSSRICFWYKTSLLHWWKYNTILSEKTGYEQGRSVNRALSLPAARGQKGRSASALLPETAEKRIGISVTPAGAKRCGGFSGRLCHSRARANGECCRRAYRRDRRGRSPAHHSCRCRATRPSARRGLPYRSAPAP